MDFEEFKVGTTTLARYCLKWYRSTVRRRSSLPRANLD